MCCYSFIIFLNLLSFLCFQFSFFILRFTNFVFFLLLFIYSYFYIDTIFIFSVFNFKILI